MEKSWREAIKRVLSESEAPLHYTEISEQILSRGYYQTDGATPAATVNAQLASSIKHDGEKSPFVRVAKGVFALKKTSQADQSLELKVAEIVEVLEDETSESIIHSFGMYWQRDLVVWRNDPRLFGKQQALAKSVDFGKQCHARMRWPHEQKRTHRGVHPHQVAVLSGTATL